MAIEAAYAPYIEQQRREIASFERDEQLKLPLDLDYNSIFGLSNEEKRALTLVKPESIGMARRCEGVTPAGALRLLGYVKGERDKERRQAMFEELTRNKDKYAALKL